MQILFIRHGEPDYSHVTERGFIGHGQDMAQLTENGKKQALSVAMDKRLADVELILSSPYTRALQTAAIISRYRNIEINVETDLHEWLPDLSHAYASIESKGELFKLFVKNKGTCTKDSPVRYEEYQHIFDRVNACLQQYLSYKKIAVVTHGLVISAFCYSQVGTPWGGIVEFEFTSSIKWRGWEE